MHEDLNAFIGNYAKKQELISHIFKLHGILLTRLNNTELVKY